VQRAVSEHALLAKFAAKYECTQRRQYECSALIANTDQMFQAAPT